MATTIECVVCRAVTENPDAAAQVGQRAYPEEPTRYSRFSSSDEPEFICAPHEHMRRTLLGENFCITPETLDRVTKGPS
jgi:hypothetical protein